jgi:glutamate---cysteine ligase / carboxylate-amine ligase
VTTPSFTLGVEEEYYLVDRESRDLVPQVPDGLVAECEARLPAQVTPEFLQTQIEVGTRVCRHAGEVREELVRLRGGIAEVAGAYGLGIIAASSHPFGNWHGQQPTAKERYADINREYGAPARRMLICGMHVHVGIDDDDLRIDLMNQVSYFLPHLLALTTSSPFWEGEETGLKSYRLSVWDGLPRTGLPPQIASWHEYQRMIDQLVTAGAIDDGSKLWWDVRPSVRFPTLEARIYDLCTRLEDAVCVAALTQCIFRLLWRLRRGNQRYRIYPTALIAENRWRAMRYGLDEGLIDFGEGRVKPLEELVEELIAMLAEDAEALGCVEEIARAREIVRDGTSAHRQLALWRMLRGDGASPEEAARGVVDMLMQETLLGTAAAA